MCVCTFLGLQCWSQWGTLVPAQWCEICCEGFDVHQVTRILLQSCETWNMCSAWNQILHLSAASSCLRLQSSCSSFPPWFWQSPLMGRSFHLQGCGKWKGASPSEGAAKGKIIRYFACGGVVQDYARMPDASIMARNRWQEQLRVLPLRLIHRLMCNFADHWCEEALPSPCEGPRRGCPGQHKRVMPKQHDLIVKNPSPSTDPSMRLRFLISLIFLRLSMMVWRCLQERPFSPQLSSVCRAVRSGNWDHYVKVPVPSPPHYVTHFHTKWNTVVDPTYETWIVGFFEFLW